MICYDFNSMKILERSIEELISLSRTMYSEFFCSIIKDMLLDDEKLRPCFEDLHTLLLPY